MKYLLLSLLITFFFSACSFLDLKNDLKNASMLSHINVTINKQNKNTAQIIIALVNIEKSTIVDYRVVKKQKQISFLILQGKYKIYAFEDSNKDYKYSHNEKITNSDTFTLLSSPYQEKNITLANLKVPSSNEVTYIKKITKSLKIEIINSSIHNGNVIPINSNIYNDKNIKKGLWQPYAFIFEVPFGIFLEKQYDPDKKVVLFIHGISGAPKNFEYLVTNLDKSKYQAMYFYYPSGASIYKVSEYLTRVLNELHHRFEFNNISVIAHSMGGLVSRNMLNILSKNRNDYIDTFITISSPLAGDKRANNGVKYSPIVMPVWKDIAYNSEFTYQLYLTPLSKKIDYHLIFGVKSDSNDDGVVSIPSQLRMEAQKEAKSIRGYNEDHMSILNSKEVSQYIYNILDAK